MVGKSITALVALSPVVVAASKTLTTAAAMMGACCPAGGVAAIHFPSVTLNLDRYQKQSTFL